MADTSDNLAVQTGLKSGGVDDARNSFASLLAAEDGDNQEGERDAAPEGADDERAEAEERPTGERDDGGEEGEEAEESDSESEEGEEEGDDEAEESDETDEETDGEEEGESDDPVYTIRVDGEDVEVPLSELKQGYSRQADYSRKTQALAEERKRFQSEAEELREERRVYSQLLPQLRQQVEQGMGEEPNWDQLYKDDPVEYVRQQQLWNQRKEKLQAVQAEERRLQEEQSREQRERLQRQLKEEAERLPEVIPEWRDADVRKQESTELMKYGVTSLGFTEQEMTQIADSRAVAALRKAWKYDQMVQRQAQAKKRPPAKKTRTAKPGTSRSKVTQTETTRAKRRLANSNSVKDAAAYFETVLD